MVGLDYPKPPSSSEKPNNLKGEMDLVLEELHTKYPEFIDFYRDILTKVPEEGIGKDFKGALSLNPKLAITNKEPWIYSEPGKLDETLWYQLQKYVYASEFNEARDEVRYTLEDKFPGLAENHWWEHLELFIDDKIVKKDDNQKRKEVNQNAFNSDEGIIPGYPEFGKTLVEIVNAKSDFYIYKALTLLPNKVVLEGEERNALFVLEQIISSTKGDNLDTAKKKGAKWIIDAGYSGSFTNREEKIRFLRKIRHENLDITKAAIMSNAPKNRISELIKISGRHLKNKMPELTKLINEGKSFDDILGWLETESAPEELKEQVTKLKNEFAEDLS